MKKATTAFLAAGTFVGGMAVGSSDALAQSATDAAGAALSSLKGMIGAGVRVMPEYEGAADNEFDWFPAVDLTYNDLIFLQIAKAPKLNVVGGYNITRNPNLRVAATVGFISGREADDSALLKGMGDVGDAIELGVTAEYVFDFMKLDFSAGYDVSAGHGGIVADAGVGFGLGFGKLPRQAEEEEKAKVEVLARLGVSYGNQDYMASAFGVNETQAANSGFSTYNPEGGLKDISLEVQADVNLTQRWSITAKGGYARMIDQAEGSPLVGGVNGVGNVNQISGSLGVNYIF